MYLNELKRNLTYQLVSEQEVDKEKLYTMSVVIDPEIYMYYLLLNTNFI